MSTRYFYTGNASVPFKLAGQVVHFDRLRLSGGAWKGVYSTEDAELADALAEVATEISEEEFNRSKKNKRGLNPNFMRPRERSLEPGEQNPTVVPEAKKEIPATVGDAISTEELETPDDPLADED